MKKFVERVGIFLRLKYHEIRHLIRINSGGYVKNIRALLIAIIATVSTLFLTGILHQGIASIFVDNSYAYVMNYVTLSGTQTHAIPYPWGLLWIGGITITGMLLVLGTMLLLYVILLTFCIWIADNWRQAGEIQKDRDA